MTDKEINQAIKELKIMLQAAQGDFYSDRRKSLLTAISALWYILSSNGEKCDTGQNRAFRIESSADLWQMVLND